MKNHLAIRYSPITLCGISSKLPANVYWADAVKAIKSNPDYKVIKFCANCNKIFKSKRIKQLTAEECKQA